MRVRLPLIFDFEQRPESFGHAAQDKRAEAAGRVKMNTQTQQEYGARHPGSRDKEGSAAGRTENFTSAVGYTHGNAIAFGRAF